MISTFEMSGALGLYRHILFSALNDLVTGDIFHHYFKRKHCDSKILPKSS